MDDGKGRETPKGQGSDPSSGFVPQPPSPLGEGKDLYLRRREPSPACGPKPKSFPAPTFPFALRPKAFGLPAV
jgi:hypothetical protein